MTTLLRRLFFLVLTGCAAIPLFIPVSTPANTWSATPADHPPTRFVVQVVGREFRWYFRCVEGDGAPISVDRVATVEELHLPVGATVELRLTSDDYIYLFSVPELGIEQIAVPGLTNESICESREPLTIDLRVDPLCGFRFYHDELMGRIVIEADSRFARPSEST